MIKFMLDIRKNNQKSIISIIITYKNNMKQVKKLKQTHTHTPHSYCLESHSNK